jgi:hypothetical protein
MPYKYPTVSDKHHSPRKENTVIENEINTSTKRWGKFKGLIKKNLPEFEKEAIDEGRDGKYWKIRLTRNVESVSLTILIKVSERVMTYPTVDYERCFLSGIEKVKYIFTSKRGNQEFLGTILIRESNDKPYVVYKEGENSNDDEW